MKLKLIFFLLFTVVLQYFLYSQNNKLDSLKDVPYNELKKSFFRYLSDEKKAAIYANTLLRRARKENDTVNIANGLLCKSHLSEFDVAIQYSDSIISLTNNLKSSDYPELGYMLKGYFYYNKNKDVEALKYYLKANDFAKKKNNLKLQNDIKQFIGNLKSITGNHNEALVIYREQLKLLKQQQNYKERYKTDYLYVLDNLSKAYLRKKDLDSASIFIKDGLKFSKKINKDEFYYSFLLNHGCLNFYRKNYLSAIDSLNKAKPHLRDNSLVIYYYYYGKIHESSNLNLTIESYLKIDSIYSNFSVPSHPIREAYKTLYEYYSKKGKTKEQIKYVEKLIKTDSLLKVNYKNIDNDLLTNYDIPKLTKEKDSLKLQLLKNNKSNKILVVALGLFTLLAVLLISNLYYKQNKYKKRYKEIISGIDSKLTTKKETILLVEEDLKIPDVIINDLLKKLEIFEEKKGFLENRLTLNKLSKDLNTNSTYLSKIINYYKKQSFSSYLTNLRIEYSINELKVNSLFRSYTINAIAEEVGFNNSESFSKAFFREKGIYPSYFIKQLNKV